MKTASTGDSRKQSGFWTRVASALEGVEASSIDLLESRIARLEKEVARLIAKEDDQPGISGSTRRAS